MHYIRSIVTFVILAVLLSGCGSVFLQKYQYIPPKNEMDKQCVARCVPAQNYCSSICRLKNPRCYARADQRTNTAFERYQKQQIADGKAIVKTKRAFADDARCRDACHCITAYNTCYSACGGEVIPLQ
ncbi:MAG: hypothetical protein WAW86_01395 [Gammaproteobacteria bacterium]